MKLNNIFHISLLTLTFAFLQPVPAVSAEMTPPPAPLYRDPMFDGAADPVVVWNRAEKNWWMLYTARRANVDAPDVAYCYGCDIGVASSDDHGRTWVYRGSLDLDIEPGRNTFWAPDVVYFKGTYHLFVAYIQGVRSHWGGVKRLAHYTSKDLWNWKFDDFIKINSASVIDASLMQMPDGKWHIWYKDESRGSITMTAESEDLFTWKVHDKPAIDGRGHEGPKAFRFQGSYWMLTDEWQGMRVYRSDDAQTWTRQGLILDKPSKRPEDTPSGAHGDVIVVKDREGKGEKAYIIYFTHPGRKFHSENLIGENGVLPYDLRRSSIQAAELKLENGTLTCDRDREFDFYLPDQE